MTTRSKAPLPLQKDTLIDLRGALLHSRRKFPDTKLLFSALGEEVGELSRALEHNTPFHPICVNSVEVRLEAIQVAVARTLLDPPEQRA